MQHQVRHAWLTDPAAALRASAAGSASGPSPSVPVNYPINSADALKLASRVWRFDDFRRECATVGVEPTTTQEFLKGLLLMQSAGLPARVALLSIPAILSSTRPRRLVGQLVCKAARGGSPTRVKELNASLRLQLSPQRVHLTVAPADLGLAHLLRAAAAAVQANASMGMDLKVPSTVVVTVADLAVSGMESLRGMAPR